MAAGSEPLKKNGDVERHEEPEGHVHLDVAGVVDEVGVDGGEEGDEQGAFAVGELAGEEVHGGDKQRAEEGGEQAQGTGGEGPGGGAGPPFHELGPPAEESIPTGGKALGAGENVEHVREGAPDALGGAGFIVPIGLEIEAPEAEEAAAGGDDEEQEPEKPGVGEAVPPGFLAGAAEGKNAREYLAGAAEAAGGCGDVFLCRRGGSRRRGAGITGWALRCSERGVMMVPPRPPSTPSFPLNTPPHRRATPPFFDHGGRYAHLENQPSVAFHNWYRLREPPLALTSLPHSHERSLTVASRIRWLRHHTSAG